MKKCPHCGLISPPEAQVCDCGFDLEPRQARAKKNSNSSLAKDIVEVTLLLVAIGALGLFFATPFDATVKIDLRKSSNPLLRSILHDPTITRVGYERLTQEIDASTLGFEDMGKVHVSVEPPFLIGRFSRWGSFLEERHVVDDEGEIHQAVNWMRVGIEGVLGLLIACIPLFKWPAKLVRAYLNASD